MTEQSSGISHVSEQRFRHLFENTPVCILVVDLTVTPAIILEVNRRTELVYGYTAAELVGHPATLLVPEEAKISAQNIQERAQLGETVTTEITNRHRDGTIFPVRVIAIIDPTHSGRMIITVEDITTERERRNEADAIESERLRIAHEIHDGVAQSLAGMRLKSALWSHQADQASPSMRAALDELESVLVKAIEDIRRAIFALRPVDLDTLGLISALTEWVADFGEQNQLLACFDAAGSLERLPASYELPLFRIIQEGVNNIKQHANAKSAFVGLTVDPTGGVSLILRDDGSGFDPRLVGMTGHSGHFGLLHMRERIVEMEGTLDIHSAIGQGTELLITLPSLTKDIDHVAN